MPQNEIRRIYRSRQDQMLAGVCGGIAEYMGVDPSVVRLIWLVLSLTAGTGLWLYIACWLIIPENPNQ